MAAAVRALAAARNVTARAAAALCATMQSGDVHIALYEYAACVPTSPDRLPPDSQRKHQHLVARHQLHKLVEKQLPASRP